MLAVFLVSCKKERTAVVNDTVTEITQNTGAAAKEGTGKITLNCNGKQIVAEGVCGGLITMGTLTIAVKDKTNPAKAFIIDFSTDQFPLDEKEYLVKPKDYTADKNPENEVGVSFTEGLPGNKMNSWDAQENSGKLVFSVKGSEIRCRFSGIRLQPAKMYNADGLQSEGTVSGEFTLYKN